ncbi:CoA transferase [Brevibacterium sp. RIT 803]|uniref:CaiB/BaiF CoA transferase family protein n=1 Tax=Brevibacterium sp. RIT 803 TaxID=2810210 RepID=UPI00194FD5EF|nr:CoA transferase [Brevibacterium sp. RIT 803]MBM6588873.1 CoA transferase [Brevibacterium sp. RIT 803]
MTHTPLAGVRVVEVCTVASGPYCGMLLADMGADVIKIERPETGDTMRGWPPFSNGYSENFASLNRNKRSIALDLKNDEDRNVASELIDDADVIVENNRPGVMDRLGFGYESVRIANPGIVYCSISAYGQRGPRSSEAGFDLTVQAMSGIMSVTGEPGRASVKCGVPISDFATGLYAAYSISSALLQARSSGIGARLDVSMLGSSLGISALQTSQLFGSGEDPVALGGAHPRNAPYEVFRCADSDVAIAAGNNGLFAAFCTAFDRRDLLEDPRFTSTEKRASNQAELKAIVESEILIGRSRAKVLDDLNGAGVPCAPINQYSEALADPQVEAMGWVQDLNLPNGDDTKTFGFPVEINGEPNHLVRQPPLLDEHHDEIINELVRSQAAKEPIT